MKQTNNKLLFAAIAMTTAMTLGAMHTVSAQQDAATAAAKQPLPQQQSYASPEAAAKALYDVVKTHDPKLIYAVLGPGSGKVVYTGDAVADKKMRDRFLAAYDTSIKIEHNSDSKATLLLGQKDWPFPFPLRKYANGWRFDAKAGAEEIVNRRIGENELFAIKFCLAYGDAQREYAERAHDGEMLEYAQKFVSSKGKHDGLYWPTAKGELPSPLGPLFVRAKQEGYEKKGAGPVPYHGYYYRILTSQGMAAGGGAYDYIVNGHMIGGYALVAYPSRWGASGVMTFICNYDGIVFQKNLGKDSAKIAAKMTRYNPDASWSKVESSQVNDL